eukprot:Nitzschia sp. Nitz4//scaffold42_size132992//115286//115708//NITZ4_003420-RA/size132992-processed-gene-0.48-mRNA-1//-1//CDS//3329551781//2134//frame0
MWGLTASSLGRASTMAFSMGSYLGGSALRKMPLTTALRAQSTMTTPQTQYILKYEYAPDVLEKRPPHREKHLGLFQQMMVEGTCLSAGPVGPVGGGVPTGAIFVFTTEDAAKTFYEGDPYIPAGIVTSHAIEEWTVFVKE